MKTISKLLFCLTCFAVFSACEDHKIENGVVQVGLPISAAQETTFNPSQATGNADVSYNKTNHMLTFTLTWNNLTGLPTGAHIHGNGSRGNNAAIIYDFAHLIPKTASGTFTHTVLIEGQTLKESDLLNGLYYFNFHTAQNPGGEIRGQIEFYDQGNVISKKGLVMTGANEVPANSSAATGTADVTYNKGTKLLSFFLTWKNLSGIPTGSHIHGIAPKGTNAPVIFDFLAKIQKATSGSYSGSVVVDGTAINETDLLGGKYYFNIHNSSFPGGEIRTQIEF